MSAGGRKVKKIFQTVHQVFLSLCQACHLPWREISVLWDEKANYSFILKPEVMLHTFFKRTLPGMMGLIILCLAFLAFTPAGVDRYEVYLNDKLLLKEYAMKDISLKSLQLEKAKPSDQLVIYYTHCQGNTAGTGRTISVKDAKGQAIKQWKFDNPSGGKAGMVISVKELQQLEKDHGESNLTMYYASEQLPGGQLLAAL
jgi:hypothetical protein